MTAPLALTVQEVSRDGLDLTSNLELVDAATYGSQATFANTGSNVKIYIDNTAGMTDVTLDFLIVEVVDGKTADPRDVVVVAGTAVIAGPWPAAQYNPASGDTKNLVTLTTDTDISMVAFI